MIRLGGIYRETAELEKLLPRARPAFALLKGTPLGGLDANSIVGRGIAVKLFPPDLSIAEVADACIYSGQDAGTEIAPNPPDPAYESEKARQRTFIARPRPRPLP